MSRGYNRVAVLRLIGSSGPIARVQIAEQLGLSPATVTAVTRQLLDHGLIRVADRRPSKGGRPVSSARSSTGTTMCNSSVARRQRSG